MSFLDMKFALLFLQTAYNLLQQEVSLIVFPMILKSAVGSGMILHLWHVNPNLVLRGFIDSQNNDADSIVRIVEICQELKVVKCVFFILDVFLIDRFHDFSLNLNFVKISCSNFPWAPLVTLQ